ncbi:hypothetical protein KKA15_06560 [Patescibacteria group bacterium]|nr:hypothetical protein [Patescibacteria group bacterium]
MSSLPPLTTQTMESALQNDNASNVIAELTAGGRLDAVTDSGSNIWQYMGTSKCPESTKALLQLISNECAPNMLSQMFGGKDPAEILTARDKMGYTAIEFARERGHIEIAEVMEEIMKRLNVPVMAT